MRTIRLYGRLKREFGAAFRMDVATVSEAVRALEANFKGRFLRSIRQGSYRIVRGRSLKQGDPMTADMLSFRLGQADLHIVPVAAGSKQAGLAQTIIGAVIIIAAVIMAIPTGGGSLAWGTAVIGPMTAGSMAMMGGALMLGGVAQMLAPQAKVGSYADFEDQDNKPSFIFGGPVNTEAQGGPVPLVYGKWLTGSVRVNADLIVEDV